jgi:hypothetical protein
MVLQERIEFSPLFPEHDVKSLISIHKIAFHERALVQRYDTRIGTKRASDSAR